MADETKADQVASGRRSDGHYAPDSDGSVVARFTSKPHRPLPPQMDGATPGRDDPKPGPPIEDVVVSEDESSVWDARPSET